MCCGALWYTGLYRSIYTINGVCIVVHCGTFGSTVQWGVPFTTHSTVGHYGVLNSTVQWGDSIYNEWQRTTVHGICVLVNYNTLGSTVQWGVPFTMNGNALVWMGPKGPLHPYCISLVMDIIGWTAHQWPSVFAGTSAERCLRPPVSGSAHQYSPFIRQAHTLWWAGVRTRGRKFLPLGITKNDRNLLNYSARRHLSQKKKKKNKIEVPAGLAL